MLTVGLIEDQWNQLQEQFQGKSEAQFAIQPILQTHFLQPAAASGSKVQQGETKVGSSFKSFTSLPTNLLLASWSVPLQPDRAAAASLLAIGGCWLHRPIFPLYTFSNLQSYSLSSLLSWCTFINHFCIQTLYKDHCKYVSVFFVVLRSQAAI